MLFDVDFRSDKRNESNRCKLCIQLFLILLNLNSFMFVWYFSEQVDGSVVFWYQLCNFFEWYYV